MEEDTIGYNKIKRTGMENVVLDLRARGKSLQEIAEYISKESGIEISYGAVFSYLKEFNRGKKLLIKEKKTLQRAQIKRELVLVDDLISIKDKLQKYLEKELAKEDSRLVPATANALTKNLELLSKLLGEFKITHETKVEERHIYEIAPKISETFQRLQRTGKLYCKRCKSREISFDLEEHSAVIEIDNN